MKNIQQDHLLVFSVGERRGIVLFLVLNLLLIAAPVVYWKYFSDKNDGALLRIEPLPQNFLSIASDSNQIKTEPLANAVKLFFFDPNTASAKQWQKLGLSNKTIQTIKHYIEKGGRFYKPEDIRKIWGIAPPLAEQLIPFVKIEGSHDLNNKENFSAIPKTTRQFIVDINAADSVTFERINGIGPTLASRIVKYRTKLGGFYAVQQIAEVWGLPDSVFNTIQKQLVLADKTWTRFNINKVDYDQLKSHPYFGYSVAKAIIRYRDQHGPFSTLEDVQRILSIDSEKYNKIAPYLKVE